MRSSTSSSDARHDGTYPRYPWFGFWLTAVAFAAGVLLGLEALVRSAGFAPTPIERPELWADGWRAVRDGDIVLLGTSRMQAGVDPKMIEQRLQKRVHQFAIPGGAVLPILQMVADDTTFRGAIAMDIVPMFEFAKTRSRHHLAGGYASAYRQMRAFWWKEMEVRSTVALDRAMVLRNPLFHVTNVPRLIWRPELRDPTRSVLLDSRHLRMDFSRVDTQVAERELLSAVARVSQPVDDDDARAIVDDFRAAVQTLRRRGVRVVMIGMPNAASVREFERRWFPRHKYWNALVGALEIEAVHAEDVPTLCNLPCPDGSHLDYRGAQKFTEWLAASLTPVVNGESLAEARQQSPRP